MNALLSPVLDRPRAARPALRIVPPPQEVARHETAQETDPELLPDSGVGQDARLLSSKLALCVIEILAGARPLDQVGRWVSDAAYKKGVDRGLFVS